MKKIFILGAIALSTLSGCTNGIEKEYTMDIKEAPVVARLKEDETQEVLVIHCRRGLSLFNYYIALPELEEDFEIPEHLVAKSTDNKTNYFIINDQNKSEKVSDHGYIFVKWGEK